MAHREFAVTGHPTAPPDGPALRTTTTVGHAPATRAGVLRVGCWSRERAGGGMMKAAACAVLGLATVASASPRMREIQKEIATMGPAELLEKFGTVEPMGPAPTHQDKIDHFVVLFMENRAFDHLFGCLDKPGVDGVPKGGHFIPKDPNNESAGTVHVTCGTAKLVCDPGPSMSMWGQHFNSSSSQCTSKYPYCGPDAQNDNFSVIGGGLKQDASIEMFAPEQLPVKKELVEEFGLFNRYFTATPTASTPNHLFAQSATSCGNTDNSLYSTCGGNTETYPQPTIYDNMRLNNVSFALYMNNTGEANWPKEYLTPVDMPDVILQGVARYRDDFRNHTDFYERAAAGTLPSVSWIHPPTSMCDHPCHDLALGERLHKDIYEALRAGPKWEKTALAIIYDDDGDFYVRTIAACACILDIPSIFTRLRRHLLRRTTSSRRSRAFPRMVQGATSPGASVKSTSTLGGSVRGAQLCSFPLGWRRAPYFRCGYSSATVVGTTQTAAAAAAAAAHCLSAALVTGTTGSHENVSV